MGHPIALAGVAGSGSRFSRAIYTALVANILFFGVTQANADALPDCAHWTSAFVFTDFMDRARVRGSAGERLYLSPANPEICATLLDPRDCKLRAYIIPKDVVTIGHVCNASAYVMYERRRSRSMGWVELKRLERLAPDPKTLAERNKWPSARPEGTSLLSAAFDGDVAGLRKAMSDDANALRRDGYGALYVAARQNRIDAMVALLDLGVNPNGVNSCQQFTNVATSASPKALELLVSRGADINCKSERELRTPLMGVAGNNRGMEIVSRAMGHAKDSDIVTAASMLLAKGARVDDVDVWGGSALRIAIAPNNVDIARLLLEKGADVNNYVDDSTSVGEQSGNTTLMSAISWFPLRKDPTMIRLLLQHKVDVNYRSKLEYDEECDRTTSGKCTFRGQTALTRAVSDGHYTVIKLLLDNGADPLLPRTDGKALMEIACDRNEIEIAGLVEEYVKKKRPGEPEMAAPCSTGWTPRR